MPEAKIEGYAAFRLNFTTSFFPRRQAFGPILERLNNQILLVLTRQLALIPISGRSHTLRFSILLMKATLKLDSALRFIGTSMHGKEAFFDTSIKGGGLDSAPSPMDSVLMAAAACSAMDVIPILQKRRKTVTDLTIYLTAKRAETEPRVFTQIEMDFHLVSPDATIEELSHAIELSHAKYCSVSVMLSRSGCEITWKASISSS